LVEQIRIAVIDDHPLLLQGVCQTLAAKSGFLVVGVGGNAADALRIAQEDKPDIMLLDISMPGDGIEAAKKISARHRSVKLIILTVSERDDHLKTALEIGARGYILKGISGPELQSAVLAVHEGKTYITPDLATRVLFNQVRAQNTIELQSSNWGLATRETDVMMLLREGKNNKEIGDVLGLSEKTIKRHMSSIMQKLGAKSRLEVVVLVNKSLA
jgi:two-component system, NarL family, nitrate/nitrite response regulator NarL